MLLITANRNDITTISTPCGDLISVAIKGYRNNQFVVGIDAPEEYMILRSGLRKRIINQMKDTPIFIVSSALHCRWAIAARDEALAIAYYRQQYPHSIEVETERVEHPSENYWFERMVNAWPTDVDIPVGVRLLL
ncbi:MAG: carbon storage regulator [Marinobacterium sp.]|nr:carbon storage regulator [Marinobacterium sp.]